MSADVPTIYLIAPNANALTIRRLEGYGLAVGVRVRVASAPTDLTTIPQTPAVLVIPDQLRSDNSVISAHPWAKIFTVSEQVGANKNTSNAIFVNSLAEHQSVWAKVLKGVFEALKPADAALSWYAVTHHERCQGLELHRQIKSWCKQNKITSYGSISQVLKHLDHLPRESLNIPVTAQASLDHATCHLSLQFDGAGAELLESLNDLAHSPFAQFSLLRRESGKTRLILQVALDAQTGPTIHIIESNDDTEASEPKLNQEAS